MDKARQKLKQVQRQRLSPVQRLCGQLLEIPLQDLDLRIAKEQENNPYLESESSEEEDESAIVSMDSSQELSLREKEEYTNYWFEDSSDYDNGAMSEQTKEVGYNTPNQESFTDDLLNQLSLSRISDLELEIGREIIGNLDDRGYLTRSEEAIVDDFYLNRNIDVTQAQVHKVLQLIQSFEPAGIAARDTRECLLLQLERKQNKGANQLLAERLVGKYWEQITKFRFDSLIRKLGCTKEEFMGAMNEISKLNVEPAYSESIYTSRLSIVPDFMVWNNGGNIEFQLNRSFNRRLRVSAEGERMLKEFEGKQNRDEKTIGFLKEKIESAKVFIEAFNRREETLYKIMKAIISYQNEYFQQGDLRKLKPMKYEDIRRLTGFGESTVSRMANEKYAQTHFGTFRLKDFFSNSVKVSDSEEVSSDAIRSVLEEIIEQEDKNKPLTDQELAVALAEKGYNISRRTVAKYRDRLDIPTASLRKRMF